MVFSLFVLVWFFGVRGFDLLPFAKTEGDCVSFYMFGQFGPPALVHNSSLAVLPCLGASREVFVVEGRKMHIVIRGGGGGVLGCLRVFP